MSREEKKKEGPGEFGAMEINAGEGREARPPAVTCPEKLRAVLNYVLQRGGGERGVLCLFMACPDPTSYRTQAFGFFN